MTTNNSIDNTLPSPFTVGATSVTSTGTQLNYLNGLTAVPINKINVQQITATGAYTYTPTSGTKYAIFELQAGGGGSGGTGGAGGQGSVGGGGGGGGYMKILVSGTANLAAVSGSVGVGGTAGTNAPGNGGAGGNTTLIVNSGTTWTAGGGNGGLLQAASASAQEVGLTSGGTNTNGTNGTLLIAIPGGVSTAGFIGAAAGFPAIHSIGGSSQLGATSNQSAGNNYGNGALGFSNNTGSNSVGFAGGQGIVLVTEFISA